MAATKKRRKAPRKAPRKALRKQRVSTVTNLLKSGVGVGLLIGAVVVAALLAAQYLPRNAEKKVSPPPVAASGRSTRTEKPAGTVRTPPTAAKPKATPSPAPRFEVYPHEEVHASPTPAPPSRGDGKPRLAIIIDDLGYDRAIAARFLSLGIPLTLAILPHSPHQKQIAEMVREKGCEVMLHLPMEPVEYPRIQPGPGALLTSMEPDRLIAQLQEDLRVVPHVIGVNNHMGSRMTAISSQMNQIFSVLKKRGLFFIDSRTTSETVCRSSARLFRVPFAERDVFLDHVVDAAFVQRQLERLLARAAKRGVAIGIGHPNALTWTVLERNLPLLRSSVQLVPASTVVRVPG
jgi:polysaccharide deacetylase 2 family uncharacterized protein YibQ